MYPLFRIPLFTSACLALLGCVGNDDDFYRQPYAGNYNGSSAFVAPQYSQSWPHGHLYSQSRRSWQNENRRSSRNSWQNWDE